MKIALFDVDGTLISSDSGHNKAFERAFENVFNIEASIGIIDYEGLTDKQIIKKVLRKKGLKDTEIQSKIEDCFKKMEDYFLSTISERKINILPGVRDTLATLKDNQINLGLATGNIEEIAYAKLKRVKINKYFEFGAFGDEGDNRGNIVQLAIRKSNKSANLSRRNIFLTGDSPNDVKAGKKNKINTVAVASGTYSKKELEEADITLKNFEDNDKFLEYILK